MYNLIHKMMQNEKEESTKKNLLIYLIAFSVSHSHVLTLIDWLKNGINIDGYTLQRVN